MHFSKIALLAFVGSAIAQGAGDKGSSTSPDSDGCFESCFKRSGCPPGDETCFCNSQPAVDKAACCVSKECSPEGQKIVGMFAHFICQRGTAKIPQKQADGCKNSRD
ncbi:uncharacterized protein J3D65DRAFT_600109 [Phyllosticta citribraziliensis]|uniref:CFEM domain-containing protein n=1 Tax=Phyllosticta citribraziliensis TaxID=989973 RepID=A0ABR1M439_9PEZI